MTAVAGESLPQDAAIGWRRRILIFLAIQALVVVAGVLLLQLPLPDPSASLKRTEALLELGGEAHPVRLPMTIPRAFASGEAAVFTFTFDRPAGEAGEGWSVFLPRFILRAVVAVNGATVLDTALHHFSNRPDFNTPEIAAIPDALLRVGTNTLTVRLYASGALRAYLGPVYVGPDQALRPVFQKRILLFSTLQIVFAAWQAILAVLLFVIWLTRRSEPAFGLLSLAMTFGVLRIFVSAPLAEAPYPILNGLLIASGAFEAPCVVLFVGAFFGVRFPRAIWLLFVPGTILALSGLLGDPRVVLYAYLALGPTTVAVSLIVGWITLAWVVARDGTTVATLLGGAFTLLVTFLLHDGLAAARIWVTDPYFFVRLAYSSLLVTVGICLTWRFASAMNQVDTFAGTLVTKVKEAEDRLRVTLAREEERARATALSDERNRLMRDLHDGLGGQLVSIVALSERPVWEGERIGDAARAALRDLRLVIDALDDIDGDLMLALATWRERTAARLRPHGLALDWIVRASDGMPLHPELRPWHVIQILRLLDEAVTNAVKHARCTRVSVRIETFADDGGARRGRIVVEDDGQGFPADMAGAAVAGTATSRGLPNMRKRAGRCGAELFISSGPGGTSVRLDLPRAFPRAELTAG